MAITVKIPKIAVGRVRTISSQYCIQCIVICDYDGDAQPPELLQVVLFLMRIYLVEKLT